MLKNPLNISFQALHFLISKKLHTHIIKQKAQFGLRVQKMRVLGTARLTTRRRRVLGLFVSANDDVGLAKNWKFESSRGFCSLFQPIRAMGPLIFRAGPTNANF